MRGVFQTAQGVFIQRRGNQQHRVRPPGARLVNLVLVDHKIFAQHRQRHRGACSAQIVGRTLEILLVGQHRQTGRAGGFIIASMVGGAEVRPYQPFGRAGFFDFGNDGRQIGGMLGTDGGDKIARRSGIGGAGFDFVQRQRGTGGGHFLGFGGKDFLQNVGHKNTQNGNAAFRLPENRKRKREAKRAALYQAAARGGRGRA